MLTDLNHDWVVMGTLYLSFIRGICRHLDELRTDNGKNTAISDPEVFQRTNFDFYPGPKGTNPIMLHKCKQYSNFIVFFCNKVVNCFCDTFTMHCRRTK